MQKNTIISIVVLILAIIAVGYFAQFLPKEKINTKPTETPEEVVMCTADAMMCPDGSYVGRTGPKCEFICPNNSNTDNTNPVIIDKISKQTFKIGETVYITGTNLSGFENDKNIWIQNNNGEKGIIYGTKDSTSEKIIFAVENKHCSEDTSYSGLPCSKYINITAGDYTIFTSPWGKDSNKVAITIIK